MNQKFTKRSPEAGEGVHNLSKGYTPVQPMEASVERDLPNDRSIQQRVSRAYEFADLSDYSLKDRLLIRAADLVFYLLINFIGLTARFEVIGWDNHDKAEQNGGLPIYVFWHDRIFLTTYWWRKRRIVVMTSRSFDGEYIARFIQRFGYGAVRGSSTRGAVGAVVEMAKLMRAGCTTAFTIDGPKGPRYVAKMGAVLLAKKTGHPIMPVTMALKRYWKLPSWDQFQIPKPFTKARVYVAPPIYVPGDADEQALNAKRDELQAVLDDLNRKTDEWRNSS
ncbi:MAG TPA: lysophospholipid acyltransferase family protein [Pyrinomonadaceae bacterium]|nr:lysophospholipid acyltransferase family protein [Pyrinomonadaceae bacterium]